ncbi:MAG: hypothetical protein AB1546_09860 [bacterium]
MNLLHDIANVEAIASDRFTRYFASVVVGIIAGAFFVSTAYIVITAVSVLLEHVIP